MNRRRERKGKKEREREKDMLRRILFTRQIDGPESCLNAAVLFSDIITLKGQMQRQHPSQSPLAKPRRDDPLYSSPPVLLLPAATNGEWRQNNLPFIRDIRSHSNPGNRFPLPSSSSAASSLSFVSARNYFHSLVSTRKAHRKRCTEIRRHPQPPKT